MSQFTATDFEKLVKSQTKKQADKHKCESVTQIQLVLFYSVEQQDVVIDVLKQYKKTDNITVEDLLGWKSVFVSDATIQKIKDGIKEKMHTNSQEMNIAEGQMRIMFLHNPHNVKQIIIWLYNGINAIKQMTFEELLN